MSHISWGCYQSVDQQTAELSEPHNFYKKLCVKCDMKDNIVYFDKNLRLTY